MKYKCIKDCYYNQTKIASKYDILTINKEQEKVYNITTGVDWNNIEIKYIMQYLENVSDSSDCTCKHRFVADQFTEITDRMHEIYLAKNADYGNSFTESINEWGLQAPLIRMSDKINRLKTLVRNKEQKVSDESIKDTLLDLANYAIMTIMAIDPKVYVY